MNQRGEATLLCVLILVVISGLLTLCGLKLQHSFSLMKKRTHLFLCVKETRGEMHRYLELMGRTNWAIKNTTRAQLIMIFVPGLQGMALNAEKVKKTLKHVQNMALAAYIAKAYDLKKKGCPLDPRLLLTPFKLGQKGYVRGPDGRALIRKKEWSYHFLEKPYLVSLGIRALDLEAIYPTIYYRAEEKGAMLSSLLSSR